MSDSSSPSQVAPAGPGHLVPLETARLQLATIWFSGCAIFLVNLAIATFTTLYTGKAQQLWSWALPTFMPTLGLIVSVLAGSAIVADETKDADICVRRGFFLLSRGISLFYLGLLLLSAWLIPVAVSWRDIVPPDALGHVPSDVEQRIEGLALASYFLTPIQSLVVVFMGAMFFTKEKKSAKARSGGGRLSRNPSPKAETDEAESGK